MFVVLAIVLQTALAYELLTVEDARGDAAPLIEALEHADVDIRRQAIRALGRFEREALAVHVGPFLADEDASLRIEAANALAQMGAGTAIVSRKLRSETSPDVRSALYEALGRLPGAREDVLREGLTKPHPVHRGAAKGMEHFLRSEDLRPSDETKAALRRLAREAPAHQTRQLALLALNRAGDRDVPTLEAAWQHDDARVRRLAVLGLGEYRKDPSPLVRYAGLKADATCEHARASLDDDSAHVVLLAIDSMVEGCDAAPLRAIVRSDNGWRRQAHALVSLSTLDPSAARQALPRFVSHEVWQARVYAARAAKVLRATDALAALRDDDHPRVLEEALETDAHAATALGNADYGVLMRALSILEDAPTLEEHTPLLLRTLRRVSDEGRLTSRDPRRRILELLSKLNPNIHVELNYLLSDFDPFIADRAAELMSARGHAVSAAMRAPEPAPVPPLEALRSMRSARARITMKEAGSFVLELLPDEAPWTSAQFVKLAEEGWYDGTTFHRVVPNFVLQGGSPGANEFVGTPGYLRDEVGLRSHERGTLGISTRGRDTGDSQIFINLVDNYRLDHNYTVFARVVEGMENVDRIVEGDVMMKVAIER